MLLCRLDNDRQKNSEAQAAIRNLVLMIASLCMCGYTELRPNLNQSGSLFQMQGFTMPQTSSRGTCIRNVHAFQVLQTIFLKSNSTPLCCNILDAISSVYHSDNANYFILESQNTLCQFTEKIHVKSQEIQEKFFELLEFIVFQLNFVPCKELISMSILLKSNLSIDCSISCMKTLLNILKWVQFYFINFLTLKFSEEIFLNRQTFIAECKALTDNYFIYKVLFKFFEEESINLKLFKDNFTLFFKFSLVEKIVHFLKKNTLHFVFAKFHILVEKIFFYLFSFFS